MQKAQSKLHPGSLHSQIFGTFEGKGEDRSLIHTHCCVIFRCFLNLAQPKSVFRLLRSCGCILLYQCWVECVGVCKTYFFFIVSDILDFFKVLSVAFFEAFNCISCSRAKVKLCEKFVNEPKTTDSKQRSRIN